MVKQNNLDSARGAKRATIIFDEEDTKPTITTKRISKSYTLRPDVANRLAIEAEKENLTASRYLENLIKREFDIK